MKELETKIVKFSEERDLPVFIILGIGGEPCEPEDIYIIPLEKATFVMTPSQTTPNALVYELSQLKPFKRMDINAPLCLDEFLADDTLLPSLTTKLKHKKKTPNIQPC